MDRNTFISLDQGLAKYIDAYDGIIKPDDIEAHKTTFMAGAASYDSILFRAAEQLGEELGPLVIKAIHGECEAFVRAKVAEHSDSNMIKRN